jgi:hypothetical protein
MAAGPRQCSYSQIRVPQELLLHFTGSHSRLLQPGRPDPRIYNPQDQGDPVMSPGTGFPFRRLLRLAALRWRYSIPPPYGMSPIIMPTAGTTQKTAFSCSGGVFTAPLHNSGHGKNHLENTVLLLSGACMSRALPSKHPFHRVIA